MDRASTGSLRNSHSSKKMDIKLSTVRLNSSSDVKRLPRSPNRIRPKKFISNFDAQTLYFDCFYSNDGGEVLCIGPAPTNLKKYYKRATYRALPSGHDVKAKHFFSLSVMSTRLQNVPIGTTHIEMCFANENFQIQVQPSLSNEFSNENVLFTLSKNNDLAWIKYWADYHVRHHGVSAIVFFDNGSNAYNVDAIHACLADIPGLEKICVISVPYPYGYKDDILKVNPYWPQFLQVSCMSIVLRRFGVNANSIVNLDIDELAVSDGQICSLVKSTDIGILSMKGVWIEPIAEEGSDQVDHRSFSTVKKNPEESHVSAGKWVIDPSRKWLAKYNVFPYMHWIEGRPLLGRRYIGNAHFLHFKAINTGWKVNRHKPQLFDDLIHEKQPIKW